MQRQDRRGRGALVDVRPFSEVFEDAAAQAIGKIHHDAKAFADDEEATALFNYLEENLFSADLNVHNWRSGAGVTRKTDDRAVAALGRSAGWPRRHDSRRHDS